MNQNRLKKNIKNILVQFELNFNLKENVLQTKSVYVKSVNKSVEVSNITLNRNLSKCVIMELHICFFIMIFTE